MRWAKLERQGLAGVLHSTTRTLGVKRAHIAKYGRPLAHVKGWWLATMLPLFFCNIPQRLRKQPVQVTIRTHRKRLMRLHPRPFPNRSTPRELLLRILRSFKQKKIDHFFFFFALTTKTKRGATNGRDKSKILKACFFTNFTNTRLHQRFTQFLFALRKRISIERIFDKKDL